METCFVTKVSGKNFLQEANSKFLRSITNHIGFAFNFAVSDIASHYEKEVSSFIFPGQQHAANKYSLQ